MYDFFIFFYNTSASYAKQFYCYGELYKKMYCLNFNVNYEESIYSDEIIQV